MTEQTQETNKTALKTLPKTHYVVTAGLCGYLPNYLGSCESYDDAVNDLADLHEMTDEQIAELREFGYVDLDLHEQGNEYAEITSCDCDNPDDHNAF